MMEEKRKNMLLNTTKLLTLLLLLIATGVWTAQDYTKEELLSKLKTRESKLALEQAKTEMERAKLDLVEMQGLFDSKIIAIDELNGAKRGCEHAILKYKQATIELEKTRLNLLQNAILIRLIDAKKYRSEEGRIMVSVSLRNDSDIGKARIAMEDNKGNVKQDLAHLLTVDNVIVSMRGTTKLASNSTQAGQILEGIVGDPYQHIIKKFRLNQNVVLRFRLLQTDIENITLMLTYLGKTREHTVFLKKEDSQDLPSINSTQYAQQGQLGRSINYDLALERLAKTEQSFSLIVLNLPKEFPFAFKDPKSSASITHLKFTEQISKQNLNFELTIPEKLDQSFIEQSVEFVILVCRQKELIKIHALKKKFGEKDIPPEELIKINCSKVNLILIPKGAGRLEMVIPNLFKEIKKGEDFSIKYSILNSGTMEMRRITPEVDLPLEWEGILTPKVIEVIEPGQKALVKLEATIPGDVMVGEYTIKISANGFSGVETVESIDKNFTVRVAAESNIFGTAILVIILIGMVVAIAVASIKISRR